MKKEVERAKGEKEEKAIVKELKSAKYDSHQEFIAEVFEYLDQIQDMPEKAIVSPPPEKEKS